MGSTHIVALAVATDSQLAKRVVQALTLRGLTVIPNRDAGGYDDAWGFLYDAAGVVLAFQGPVEVRPGAIPSGLERVVPVLLAYDAQLPPEYARLEPIDLTGDVDAGPRFDDLVRRLDGLVQEARQRSSFDAAVAVDYASSITESDAAVSSPLHAVGGLDRLAGEVQRLGEILAADDNRTRQVRATLDEIGSSYRVVLDAIDEFYAVGAGPNPPDMAALAKLTGGRLAERIHNGRGHCKRIGARYFAEGGLRQAIKSVVSAPTLKAADATFRALTDADLDVFMALDSFGLSLTREARQLYALVLAGRQSEASKQLLEAHERLAPLEETLNHALRRFQDVEQALGFAQDSPQEAAIVEDRSINIYGNVSGGVVAQTIERSRISIRSAGLPEDLQRSMSQLVSAVDEMLSHLPPDDAEAAAAELEQLTQEVAGAKPRIGIVKKCLRSLEQFGKGLAEVGLPVVELVTKVSALFDPAGPGQTLYS